MRFVNAHDGVVAERADEASLLAVVRAKVIMSAYAIGELKVRAA